MIRRRISELSIAAVRCIEAMRVVRHLAGIPQALLELLGPAACSVRAIYWAFDPGESRPQAIATWGELWTHTPASQWDIRYRATGLSQGKVGRVWRSGNPLWSATFVLDTPVSSSFGHGSLGGVWFAVKTDSTVYAVIELLGRVLEPDPPEKLILIEQLGYRLGYALEELRYGNQRGRHPWKTPGGKP